MDADRGRSRPAWGDPDAELTAALSVEPSPEFLARVRLRIASEPPPAGWRVSSLPATAGVLTMAAACVAGIAVSAAVLTGGRGAGPSAAAPSAAVLPAEPSHEPPTPAMRAAMRSNEDVTALVRARLAERDYAAIAALAAAYRRNFVLVEAFWASRRQGGATGLARSALEASRTLEAAARTGDHALVVRAVAALTATCGACHSLYRIQTSDGRYAVKL